MAVPTYDAFIEPLLRFLALQAQPVSTREVYRALADGVGLNESDRQQLLPSQSQLVYQNRIGWAHDRLKRIGYSHSPRRAMWQLTETGRQFLEKHPQALSDYLVETIANCPRESVAAKTIEQMPVLMMDADPPSKLSPDERIDAALREVRDRTASELLERIFCATPVFFERLVLELLHALGYGTTVSDLQHVGQSGDGGIDGVISLDRLGLEKVCVQAKRWKGTGGRPDVQAFFGALAGRRATKGVFITTSTYSAEAHAFAASLSDKIVLVDGAKLTELMMDSGVGVSHKPLKIPRLDSDYFEDG